MRPFIATFDCDAVLSAFEAEGFVLRQTYEALLEGYALRGDLCLHQRAPPNGLVRILNDGIDVPLQGQDTAMWRAAEDAGSNSWFGTFGKQLEQAKRSDASYPSEAFGWDGTKKEMAYLYRKIGSELELTPPLQSRLGLEFSLPVASGSLRLELVMGGRPRVGGRLPVYFHFWPNDGSSSVFLSSLAWIHETFDHYLRFATIGERADGLPGTELHERSAIHGIRASLTALRSLATHIV